MRLRASHMYGIFAKAINFKDKNFEKALEFKNKQIAVEKRIRDENKMAEMKKLEAKFQNEKINRGCNNQHYDYSN